MYNRTRVNVAEQNTVTATPLANATVMVSTLMKQIKNVAFETPQAQGTFKQIS